MKNIWLIADPHFGHKGVTQFLNNDGTKLRPWDNPDDMDEALIENFNSRVGVNDKCYFLGDVVINRRCLKTLNRLNCKDLVLIKGNHDIFRINEYLEYFREVRAYHVLNGMIFSHIPIHVDSLGRFGANVCGHLHSNKVMMDNGLGEKVIDPRYLCVSVEHTNFAPIHLDEVIQRIRDQGGSIEMKQGNR